MGRTRRCPLIRPRFRALLFLPYEYGTDAYHLCDQEIVPVALSYPAWEVDSCFGSKPKRLIRQGSSMTLEASASRIATTNAWPNSLSGRRELRFSTAKPPAVVRAAAIIARPVVALVIETHLEMPAFGSCSTSSSSLVTKCTA